MPATFEPKKWGLSGWFFLFMVAFAYPSCSPKEDEMEAINQFFMSLKHVLPCWNCRTHYQKHVKRHPMTRNVLKSRSTLVKWLSDIYNDVRKQLNQPTMSYEEIILKFTTIYNEGGLRPINENKESNSNWLICFIIIIFIIGYFFWKKS